MQPATEPRARSGGRTATLAVAAGLVLLVAAIYAQSGHFDSLDFDNQEYVYANENVLEGVSAHSIAWALTAFHAANWHPLTWISHMVDVQLSAPRRERTYRRCRLHAAKPSSSSSS